MPNAAIFGALLGAFCAVVAAIVVSKGVCRASGWKALSERYPCRAQPPRPRRLGGGVFNGWFAYNNCIFYATDEAGLYLLPMPVILSWSHDPIFIPWSEVEAFEERRHWYGADFALRARAVRDIDFAIKGRSFEFVRPAAAAAGVPIRPGKS